MKEEQSYSAANLPPELLAKLQSFEDELADQADKNVILIAYEEKEKAQH